MPRKKLSPGHGGCWFCSEDETDAFDTEFDTNLHLDCLRETLAREPDHPEAVHMRYLLEPFVPDWASPPGQTIAELIVRKVAASSEPVKTMVAIPDQFGLEGEVFRQLLTGEMPITEPLAQKLEAVLGGPVQFWLRRESQYRELMARRLDAAVVAERIKAAEPSFVPSVSDRTQTMTARRDLVLLATEFLRMKGELAELKREQRKGAVARLLKQALEEPMKQALEDPVKQMLLDAERYPLDVEPTAENPRPGSLYYRAINEHDEVVVYPMLLNRARLCLSHRGDESVLDAYCYDSRERAIEAAKVWTGEGDPLEGWNRHPNSGRRRPDGDPAKEHVAP